MYFTLGLVGSVLYLTLSKFDPILVPIFLLMTAYGLSSACMVNWLTNSMLFPTNFQSSTNGICSVFARLSNILAPQVAELGQPIPMIVVAVIGFTAAILSQLLIIEPVD